MEFTYTWDVMYCNWSWTTSTVYCAGASPAVQIACTHAERRTCAQYLDCDVARWPPLSADCSVERPPDREPVSWRCLPPSRCQTGAGRPVMECVAVRGWSPPLRVRAICSLLSAFLRDRAVDRHSRRSTHSIIHPLTAIWHSCLPLVIIIIYQHWVIDCLTSTKRCRPF